MIRIGTFIVLFCIVCSNAFSQQKKSNSGLVDNDDKVFVSKSSLTVSEGGVPVYFNVLRLNDEIIVLLPAKYSDNIFSKASFGKYRLGGGITFVVPADKFTNDQIAELTSKYKIYAADGYLNFNIVKYNSPSSRFTKLPNYLKFTVEKLSFK